MRNDFVQFSTKDPQQRPMYNARNNANCLDLNNFSLRKNYVKMQYPQNFTLKILKSINTNVRVPKFMRL